MSIRSRIAGATFALALAGSAVGVIGTAAPASAATGGNAALQFCRSIAQFYPGDITGPCTSYFQSHDLAGIAASNEYFCENYFLPLGEFATVGDCVSALNQVTGQ